MNQIEILQMKHNKDVISTIMEFLQIHEILNSLIVCESWNQACGVMFFERLCKVRNTMNPTDYGNSSSVLLVVHDLDKLWKRNMYYRERIETMILSISSPLKQIQCIINYCNQSNIYHLQIEGWRMITQLFDENLCLRNKHKFPQITENDKFIGHILDEIDKYPHSKFCAIAAKTIGILSVNEHSRLKLAQLNCIPKLMKLLESDICINDTILTSCVIWSLVILSRPIGAIEAQEYETTDFHSAVRNTYQVIKLGAVPLILKIAKFHHKEPLILAKIFWLIVNLSLIGDTKQFIAENGGITIICDAMRNYKYAQELQYRAIFAIVNIGLNNAAKVNLLNEDIIKLLLNAIKQYQNDKKFVTMCLHAIRSIASGSEPAITKLNEHGAGLILVELARKYNEICMPLTHLIRHTINVFQLN